jgi:hypothetical protein
MTDHRSELTNDHPGPAGSLEDQRRQLELQLRKIRSEASAARLEARAAEIELLIRQLRDRDEHRAIELGRPINPPHIPLLPTEPAPRLQSWAQLHLVYGLQNTVYGLETTAYGLETTAEGLETTAEAQTVTDSETVTRFDASVSTIKRPYLLDAEDSEIGWVPDGEPDDAELDREDAPSPVTLRTGALRTGTLRTGPASDASGADPLPVSGQVSVETDQECDDEFQRRRRKPAAWFASTAVHLAVLATLAVITLRTDRPRDQVALSASAAEASQVSLETFTIESSEPEAEPAEPVPSETEYELSPVGQIAATRFAPEALSAPTAVTAMSSGDLSATAMSLSSDPSMQIEFCGVEGGGNHFVYLVDSSGSMGDGFASARVEVLNSIAALKPDQRFYVVFFDSQSDNMRLRDPNRDEPRSARATPENCAALRRWAMRIEMDRGRAPYEAIRFALQLRPDVIFLLSDGEFPQGIEDLLREENNVENLFGDSRPISIVHTIGYHSREGESRMRRIAEQNRGQYKYVAKP